MSGTHVMVSRPHRPGKAASAVTGIESAGGAATACAADAAGQFGLKVMVERMLDELGWQEML